MSMFGLEQHKDCAWFADSASTEHMTGNRHYFSTFIPILHNWNVKGVGSDHKLLNVIGKGDVKIKIKIGNDTHYGVLQDVLYVPSIGVNLFSIGKAADRGIKAVFEKEFVLMYRGNILELIGTRAERDLYLFNMVAVPSTTPGTILIAFPAISLNIWHKRFGHAHHAVIKKMESENSVIGLQMTLSILIRVKVVL